MLFSVPHVAFILSAGSIKASTSPAVLAFTTSIAFALILTVGQVGNTAAGFSVSRLDVSAPLSTTEAWVHTSKLSHAP